MGSAALTGTMIAVCPTANAIAIMVTRTAHSTTMDPPVSIGDPYPDNGVALAAANAEIERGRATVAEQAVALHLHAGKHVGTDRRPGPLAGG